MTRIISRSEVFNKIGYVPHREQALFHNSKARFRVPVCGRRFGKSKMAGSDAVPRLFIPDRMEWVIGPTYDLGEKEFRVIWDAMILKLGMGKDKRVKKAYNKKQGNMFIEFPWKTRLEVRSADHPENLVGEALDHAIMSEAAKHKQETWQRFIRPALTDKRGHADFPTTPEGFNWLHEVWQWGQDPSHALWESWQFPSWANSFVYPGGRQDEEILEVEQTSLPEWFAQEYGADFASFVGKIFSAWEERVNVRKVEFQPHLPNYIAFDFGFTNPLAAIEFQITPMDEVRIWREHYKSYTTIRDHIDILKNRDQPDGYRLDLAFGDPADPEAANLISQDLVQCVCLPEVKSDYTWMDGINLMNNFMKPVPPGVGDNVIVIDEFGTPAEDIPHFIVDHSCTISINEYNNYRSKEPIKGQNVPEFGHKVKDHGIDAMRYALVYIYKMGMTSSLSEVYSGRENPEWLAPNNENIDVGSALASGAVTLDDYFGTGNDWGGEQGGFGNLTGTEF